MAIDMTGRTQDDKVREIPIGSIMIDMMNLKNHLSLVPSAIRTSFTMMTHGLSAMLGRITSWLIDDSLSFSYLFLISLVISLRGPAFLLNTPMAMMTIAAILCWPFLAHHTWSDVFFSRHVSLPLGVSYTELYHIPER